VLAFWLSIFLSRSLLLLWQPAWLLSSSLISQVVWPGVLVAYGLFAMTSYLEEIQQKLKIESLTDPLTGLLNRRGMLEMATGCLAYLQRHQRPGALLMIDLDHFKNINDQLGHATGDLVLQHVATAFKQELRQSDMLARVGGEEFLIFLPMVDGKVAAVTAERLLKCVTNLQLPELEIIQQRLTISIGVSLFGPEYDFLQQQQQADLALYRAKHFGRNRIEFATD
jgi:diguanylate cyclase (GGDEF)-like protein